MKPLTNLQLITLASLSRSHGERITPYEIMIEVNHVFSLVDTPYSPGAFYPALKKLSLEKMININQSGCLIDKLGAAAIEEELLHHPLPGSFIGVLMRLIAANIQASEELRKNAVHRIDIELIKFDQNNIQKGPETGANIYLLNILRQQISTCLKRISTELRANK